MRDIVYYGLINGTVVASAIFQFRSIRKPLFTSSRGLNVKMPMPSPAAEFQPVFEDLRADLRSFRDEVAEKLDLIHREMHEHIAACQQRRLNNPKQPKD